MVTASSDSYPDVAVFDDDKNCNRIIGVPIQRNAEPQPLKGRPVRGANDNCILNIIPFKTGIFPFYSRNRQTDKKELRYFMRDCPNLLAKQQNPYGHPTCSDPKETFKSNNDFFLVSQQKFYQLPIQILLIRVSMEFCNTMDDLMSNISIPNNNDDPEDDNGSKFSSIKLILELPVKLK